MDESTMFVKMLADVGEKHKGERYEIDTLTAEQYIKLNIAEKIETPVDNLLDNLSKTLEERDERLLGEINKALAKSAATRVPAVAKGEDHADWSMGEYFKLIGKAGDPRDHNQASRAQEMLGKKYKSFKTIEKDFEADGTKANLNQTTSGQGGYLVPQLWNDVLMGIGSGYDYPIFPNRCTTLPVEKGTTLNVPVGDYSIVPNGTGQTAYANGVVVGFVAEGGSVSNTQPGFKSVPLTPKKIMGVAQVTNELLDNSPISIDAIISEKFRTAIQYYVNHRIFNGAGGSLDMTGIIGNQATYKQTRATLAKFSLVDAALMLARLLPSSYNASSTCWFVHPLNFAQLVQLEDTSGRVVWLPNLQATGRPQLTLFGFPVIPCEALPPPAQGGGDVILADASKYLVGMNKELMVMGSPIYGMTSDLFTYRFTTRLDGAPEMTSVVTLADGTTQTAWAVQLDYVLS